MVTNETKIPRSHPQGRLIRKLILTSVAIAIAYWLFQSGNQIVRSATIFLAILSGLVFAHELAHFLTARLFKIKVEEFAIGMPPRLFTINRSNINYSINMLPLGGYVKMEGEFTVRLPSKSKV